MFGTIRTIASKTARTTTRAAKHTAGGAVVAGHGVTVAAKAVAFEAATIGRFTVYRIRTNGRDYRYVRANRCAA